MKIYITSGSMEFMVSTRKRYPNEMMIAMQGSKNTVLLHETEGKTKFSTPRAYEVLASTGQLTEQGFFAINYIPINEDAQPIFEYQFKLRADSIENEPSIVALRFLKAEKSDTYAVLTQWTDAHAFNLWKISPSYKYLLEDTDVAIGTESRPYIFSSAPYVKTYKSINEDE